LKVLSLKLSLLLLHRFSRPFRGCMLMSLGASVTDVLQAEVLQAEVLQALPVSSS
jgi:hypothetical protein